MRLQHYQHTSHPLFAADYRLGKTGALERFDFLPAPSALTERVRWLDEPNRPQAPREAVVEALRAYNRTYNDVPQVHHSLDLLQDSGTLAVVGGQQAGLFTGPLLVIYKALTLIQCAKAYETLLRRPVVPLFWIAGEDHDWDEVNHTFVLNSQPATVKIAVKGPAAETGARHPVSRKPLSPSEWVEALEALAAALPDTEFKPELMDKLRRFGTSDEPITLTSTFARTMSMLFGAYGLVLLDSDDPLLRRVEASFFEQLVQHNRDLQGAIRSGERAMTSSGYPLQAEAPPDSLHLFYVDPDGRKLLFRDPSGDGALDRRGTLRLSREQLTQTAANEPEKLSNTALTRPLMQEYLLPTLATVLGPSEIAYWGVLKEAFHMFGMRMPAIVPRLEFTVLEGTVQKQMEKLGLSFEEASERLEQARDEWLKSQDELGLEERFAEVKQKFSDQYRPLVELVASINPGLRKLGETNLGKIEEQIEFLQSKSLDALKAQHETGLRHWERIRLTMKPNDKPQERVLNVCYYLARYGPAWLDRMVELPAFRIDEETPPHWVVYM